MSAPALEIVGQGQVPARPAESAWRAQISGGAGEPSFFNNGSSPSSSAQSSLLLLLPLRELAATAFPSPGPTPTAQAAAASRVHPPVPRLQLTSLPGGLGLPSGPLAASTCGGSDRSSADSSSRASSLQRLDDVMVVQPQRQSDTGDWATGCAAVLAGREGPGVGLPVAPGASPRRLVPVQSAAAPPALHLPLQPQTSPQRPQPAQALDHAQVLASAEREAVSAFPSIVNMNSPGRPRRQSIGGPKQQPQQPTQQLQPTQQQDRTPRLAPTRSQPHISVTPCEAPPPPQLLCVGAQSPGKMQMQHKSDPWTASAAATTAAAAAVGGRGCSRPCLLPAASKGRPRASSFDTPRSKGAGCGGVSCGGSVGGGAAAAVGGGLPAILSLAAVGTSFSYSGAMCSGAGCNASYDGRPTQMPQLRLPSLRTLTAAPAADGGGNGRCEGGAAASGSEWAAAFPSSRAKHAVGGHVDASSSGSGVPARGWTSARAVDPFMAVVGPAAPSPRKWEAPPAVGVQ